MGPDEFEEEYMGLYTNGQMITDLIYGQIWYCCCLSNTIRLKLRHNQKILLVETKRAIGKEIVEHIIKPAKVIPPSNVKARCVHLLIIIHKLWKVRKRVEERRERRIVGKGMKLVSMYDLIARIELIVYDPYIFFPMVACL